MNKLDKIIRLSNKEVMIVTVDNKYYIGKGDEKYIDYLIMVFNRNENEYVAIDNVLCYKNKHTDNEFVKEGLINKLKPIKDITNYLDVILTGEI